MVRSVIEWLRDATTLAAAIGIIGSLVALYRRTAGRRRDLVRRLDRLGTSAQLSFFTSVLGEPPAMRRRVRWQNPVYDEEGHVAGHTNREGHENLYINRYAFIQALTDEDETVIAYSLTTRHRRFHPRYQTSGGFKESRRTRLGKDREVFHPGIDVRLGKTPFSAVRDPGSARGWLGARRMGYIETHYLGNPGLYQSFVLGINDGGLDPNPESLVTLLHKSGFEFVVEPGGAIQSVPGLAEFRRLGKPNTLTVIGPHLTPSSYPITYGPDADSIRTLIGH